MIVFNSIPMINQLIKVALFSSSSSKDIGGGHHETKTCPDWVYVRSIGYNLSLNVVAVLD